MIAQISLATIESEMKKAKPKDWSAFKYAPFTTASFADIFRGDPSGDVLKQASTQVQLRTVIVTAMTREVSREARTMLREQREQRSSVAAGREVTDEDGPVDEDAGVVGRLRSIGSAWMASYTHHRDLLERTARGDGSAGKEAAASAAKLRLDDLWTFVKQSRRAGASRAKLLPPPAFAELTGNALSHLEVWERVSTDDGDAERGEEEEEPEAAREGWWMAWPRASFLEGLMREDEHEPPPPLPVEELTPALAPHSTAAWTGFDEDCIEPSDDLFEEYQQEESMDGTIFGAAPVVADSSPARAPPPPPPPAPARAGTPATSEAYEKEDAPRSRAAPSSHRRNLVVDFAALSAAGDVDPARNRKPFKPTTHERNLLSAHTMAPPPPPQYGLVPTPEGHSFILPSAATNLKKFGGSIFGHLLSEDRSIYEVDANRTWKRRREAYGAVVGVDGADEQASDVVPSASLPQHGEECGICFEDDDDDGDEMGADGGVSTAIPMATETETEVVVEEAAEASGRLVQGQAARWPVDEMVPRVALPPISNLTTIQELGEWAASHLPITPGAPPLLLSSLLRMASLVACPPSAQRLFLAVLWMATTHNLGRGRWAGAERQVLLSAPGRGKDGLVVSLGSNMA